MDAHKIIKEWKSNIIKPIYWFEGEETYHIDYLVDFAQKNLLTQAEIDFNLSVFYGKDADPAQVVNACMRHPVLSARQAYEGY
jgi:DNA polymerase-3 subunit delta